MGKAAKKHREKLEKGCVLEPEEGKLSCMGDPTETETPRNHHCAAVQFASVCKERIHATICTLSVHPFRAEDTHLQDD